jgi:hypothetical protein
MSISVVNMFDLDLIRTGSFVPFHWCLYGVSTTINLISSEVADLFWLILTLIATTCKPMPWTTRTGNTWRTANNYMFLWLGIFLWTRAYTTVRNMNITDALCTLFPVVLFYEQYISFRWLSFFTTPFACIFPTLFYYSLIMYISITRWRLLEMSMYWYQDYPSGMETNI